MDETSFDETGEHFYYSFLISESTKGYILNNLPGESSYLTKKNDNEEIMSVSEHNSKYPIDQVENTPLVNANKLSSISPKIITPSIWEISEMVHNYHGFVRFFADDQTLYGYESGYEPVSPEIQYESYNSLNDQTIFFRIIDNDKILAYVNNGNLVIHTNIDISQHYQRNTYNVTFPTKKIAEDNEYEMTYLNLGSYFHQLGFYTNDHSNENNVKLVSTELGVIERWPLSSYECVYSGIADSSVLVTDPLIAGTFNYYREGILHYTHDVLPYLIWGNSTSDSSSFVERFAWEMDSGNPLVRPWRFLRGGDLVNAYYNVSNRHLSETEESYIFQALT